MPIVPVLTLSYSEKIPHSELPKISTSSDAFAVFNNYWNVGSMDHVEHFNVLLLSRANRVLGFANITTGISTACLADAKLILQYAILANASSIVLAHNHPSGQLFPSKADKEKTQEIKAACEMLDISIVDHLIMTSEGYYSMVEQGDL